MPRKQRPIKKTDQGTDSLNPESNSSAAGKQNHAVIRKTTRKISNAKTDSSLMMSKETKANYSADAGSVGKKAKASASKLKTTSEKPSLSTNKTVAEVNAAASPEKRTTSKRNSFAVGALSVSSLLLILFVLLGIVPLIQVSYVVPVAYQDIENYTEQEAYTATVTYTEKEPFTVTEAYTVSEPYITYEPVYIPLPRPVPPLITPISSNTTAPYRPPRPPQPQDQSWQPVIYYADVTKYRDVLQYRDVTKTRLETRYRPVQKQRMVTRVKQEVRYRMVPVLYSMIPYQ